MIGRISVGAACALMLCAPARAELSDVPGTVYVGASGVYESVGTKSSVQIKDSGMGWNMLAGWRPLKYLGVEGSFQKLYSSNDLGSGDKIDATIQTVSFDALGYMPMGNGGWFQPFITAGVGSSEVRAHQQSTATVCTLLFSETKFHPRFGGGVEWSMGSKIAGRLTARYEPSMPAIDHSVSASLSLLVRLN